MRRVHQRFLAAIGMLIIGAAAAPASAQTSKMTEKMNFTVVSVEGNKAVLRGDKGTSQEVTVPEDFRFAVGDKQVSVHDLKPGMKGTATITTTTTMKPVYVTEVKNGEVVQVAGNTIIVRGPDGFKMFNQGDIEKRNITIVKNGEPADITQFHAGDKLTATIVTEGTPKKMTSRQVQATLHPEASGTMAANSSGSAKKPASSSASTSGKTGTASKPALSSTSMSGQGSTGGTTKKTLPKTASSLPSVGLVGVGLLLAGAFLTGMRRYRTLQ